MIQIKGSDTIVNANQKLSEEFMKVNPEIFVAVTGGGSGVGIASLINKSCNLAAASREMTAKEIKTAQKRGVEPKEIVVAFDGIAVIVHPNNPIDEIDDRRTAPDLHGQGDKLEGIRRKDLPIVTLSREVSSGTHAYFKEDVIHLGKKGSQTEFSPKTLLLVVVAGDCRGDGEQRGVDRISGNGLCVGSDQIASRWARTRTRAIFRRPWCRS